MTHLRRVAGMLSGSSRLLMVALVAGLAITAGATEAQVSGPEGTTLHACVSRTTGVMRHVVDPSGCTRYESPVSWTSYQAENLDDVYVNEGQADSIVSEMIVDGEVTTSDLADASVTSAKVLDGTVSEADLGSSSVTTDEILDGTILATDLGFSSVTGPKIAPGAVESQAIAGDSVDSSHIRDLSVQQGDLSLSLQDYIASQNGLAGYEIVPGSATVVDSLNAQLFDVSCPNPTQRVVGGGVNTNRTDVTVYRSYPVDLNTWRVGIANYAAVMFNPEETPADGGPVTVTPYAVCVE